MAKKLVKKMQTGGASKLKATSGYMSSPQGGYGYGLGTKSIGPDLTEKEKRQEKRQVKKEARTPAKSTSVVSFKKMGGSTKKK